jgi:tellurite resistance protein TehA-like permease
MKHIWRSSNIVLVILGLWGGFASMSPQRLRETNPDGILCLILLVIMPLFALGSVYYSICSGKCETLYRPSWDRHAINWWYDPLQSLFVSTCVMAAMAVGSTFRLPESGAVGFWTFAVFCCFAVGLATGQIIVYRVFRGRITDA